MRHGAKRKHCSHEGCTSFVKKGGVCIRHGAEVKKCSNEGCAKRARKGGVCKTHGAEVKKCNHEVALTKSIREVYAKGMGRQRTHVAREGKRCRVVMKESPKSTGSFQEQKRN